MSESFTDTFFSWADAQSITRHDLAEATGNTIQTISKWRSIGIPKGKQPICRMLMEQASHNSQDSRQADFRIYFDLDRERFTRWNKAALQDGKTIEDWAFDGLEEMASQHFLQVAEDQAHFGKKTNDEDQPA